VIIIIILAYSIVSIEFPYDREKRIGYCQTAVGLGLLSGPFIGQVIYNFVGYAGTFYTLAGILTFSLVLAFFTIPARINKYDNKFPNEAILDHNPTAERASVQAAPIHGIAQRHSVDVVGLAR
jgi:MFS family permease